MHKFYGKQPCAHVTATQGMYTGLSGHELLKKKQELEKELLEYDEAIKYSRLHEEDCNCLIQDKTFTCSLLNELSLQMKYNSSED